MAKKDVGTMELGNPLCTCKIRRRGRLSPEDVGVPSLAFTMGWAWPGRSIRGRHRLLYQDGLADVVRRITRPEQVGLHVVRAGSRL